VLNPSFAAERVLDELGIRNPDDLQLLDLIAWERGALVRTQHLDGAEARITIGKRRAIITVSTAIKSSQRRRFSIAHELGHLELHRAQNSISICLGEDLDDWKPQRVGISFEQEANEFASALLLPERFFGSCCRKCDPSLDYIAQLAEDFDVSLTATAIRYAVFCEEPVAVVFSHGGHIRWFRGSQDFEELREDLGFFIDVRSRLDPSTQAYRIFQNRSVRVNPRTVSASAWFTSGKYRSDGRILEQSWGMPNYDAVLTLLWVDEDIEDDDVVMDSWFM
jgi:hypothetical protein